MRRERVSAVVLMGVVACLFMSLPWDGFPIRYGRLPILVAYIFRYKPSFRSIDARQSFTGSPTRESLTRAHWARARGFDRKLGGGTIPSAICCITYSICRP